MEEKSHVNPVNQEAIQQFYISCILISILKPNKVIEFLHSQKNRSSILININY